MDERTQVLVFASQISGWCFCHTKPENLLENMGIVEEKLADFVNRIQEKYPFQITPTEFLQWVTLDNAIDYITNSNK